jgi:hypothetical protein
MEAAGPGSLTRLQVAADICAFGEWHRLAPASRSSFRIARAAKSFVHAQRFRKNAGSDEHFDDCFAFSRSETQNLKPKERKNK